MDQPRHPPAADTSPLIEALNVGHFLAASRPERVGVLPIHCEVYAHDDEAPVVIFVPGISTYAALYAELLCRLSGHGFNVVGVDLRGHGQSGGQRGDYTVDEVVADLRVVVDHFARRFTGPVSLYGYSIGASLALAAAEEDARIEALLCHTLLMGEHAPDLLHMWGWQWLRYLSFFCPHAEIPLKQLVELRKLIPDRDLRLLTDDDPLLVTRYSVRTLASVFSRRSRVMHETLPFRAAIISGDEDELIPITYLERLIERARHPFELIRVPGGSHMMPFWEAKRLAALAAGWLSG